MFGMFQYPLWNIIIETSPFPSPSEVHQQVKPSFRCSQLKYDIDKKLCYSMLDVGFSLFLLNQSEMKFS